MKFNELSTQEQAKAIDANRYINVDDDGDWAVNNRMDFIAKMKEHGFDDIKLLVDTSCTQGSGASFSTDDVDIEKFLRKVKKWSSYRILHELITIKDLACTIERDNSRYVHSNTVYANIPTWNVDVTDKQAQKSEELEEYITDFVRNESDSVHRELEALMLELSSDESVKEALIENDTDFIVMDHSSQYL